MHPEEGLEKFGDAGEFHRFSIVSGGSSHLAKNARYGASGCFQIVDGDWRLEKEGEPGRNWRMGREVKSPTSCAKNAREMGHPAF